MSKVQLLRDNLRRRLTADDKEIFELFEGVVSDYEGVIADYEEEICCLKEENKGWKVLAAVFNPQVHLYRADPQQPFLNKDDVIPEHQEHAANAVRNGSQPTNIKEEQEELWVNQEGKQLHGLGEADITKFPFAVVSVKSEDEEKPQSSQLRQNQRDERTEVELLSSTSAEHRTLKTESNGDYCGGSQPGSNSGPCSQLQPHIDAVQQLLIKEESLPEQQMLNLSVNQEDVKEEQRKLWISQPGPQAGTTKFPFTAFPVKSEDDEKPQSAQAHQSQSDESTEVEGVASSSTAHRTPTAQGDCKDYGGRQPANTSGPDSPLQPHTSGRSSDSSETDSCKWKRIKKCSSGFNCPKNGKVSVSHNRSNMTKKQMNCCEYRKECGHMNYLKRPKGRQQSEKPFRCSECGKRFGNKWNLNRHIKIHTGQKPFRCSECGKRFAENCDLNKHKKIHSGQKPFGCSECGKKFGQKSYLTKHAIIHTGHKPFSCSECGKGFGQKISLIRHMMIHTGHLALIKSQIFG